VYVLSGSSAKSGEAVDASFPHNAAPFATTDGGMLYLEVENNRLDAKLIHENGGVFDQFTILKDVRKTSELSVSAGSPITLTASWVGDYRWSNGATTRSIMVTPSLNVKYTVSDGAGCIMDVFNISITTAIASAKVATQNLSANPLAQMLIYPTLLKKGTEITIRTIDRDAREAVLMDGYGRVINSRKFTGSTYLDTKTLAAGTYFIVVKKKDKLDLQRVVVTD
jgi:hypothetical protein